MKARQRFRVGIAVTLFVSSCARLDHADEPAQPQATEEAARKELAERAKALYAEADKLFLQGQWQNATKRLEETLAVLGRLYPKEKFPQGSSDIAFTLRGLGVVAQSAKQLDVAEQWFEKSLAEYRRLYPRNRFPDGHLDVAHAATLLALLLQARGDLEKAERRFEEALAMTRRLFPDGNPSLVQALENLAQILTSRGEATRALPYRREAVAICERLYSPGTHPSGDLQFARTLYSFGSALSLARENDAAVGQLKRALKMLQTLFPPDRFPSGHIETARTLTLLGLVLQTQGKYDEAMDSYEQALSTYKRLFPGHSPMWAKEEMAGTLIGMGQAAQSRSEVGRARQCYEDALAIYERLFPAEVSAFGSPGMITALTSLAAFLASNGDFEGAVRYGERALGNARGLFTVDRHPRGHRTIADALGSLAWSELRFGDLSRAEEVARDSVAMERRLYPINVYPDGELHIADALHRLGNILTAREALDEAMKCEQEALDMYERLLPEEQYPAGCDSIALVLCTLGEISSTRGDLSLAKGYYEKALAVQQRLYPNGHVTQAASLRGMAIVLGGQGSLQAAISHAERAVEMLRRFYTHNRFPHGHPLLIRCLSVLGLLSQREGDYFRSEEYAKEALAICEHFYPAETYPDGHPELVAAMRNLAEALREQGQVMEAMRLSGKAVNMCEKLYTASKYPQGHPEIARSLSNLAFSALAEGKWEASRTYQERAVALWQQVFSKTAQPQAHSEWIVSLNDLAVIYSAKGESARARELAERALAARRSLYASNDHYAQPRVTAILSNLAIILASQNDLAAAEKCLEEAIQVATNARPESDHADPDIALYLGNLAAVLHRKGEYERAAGLYDKSLNMHRHLFPAADYPHGHRKIARILVGLGLARLAVGDVSSADLRLAQARAMSDALYPIDSYPNGHPELAQNLLRLGYSHLARGDAELAAECVLRCNEMRQAQAEQLLSGLSQGEALNFASTMALVRDYLISVWAQTTRSHDDLYTSVWRGDRITARTLSDRQRRLLASASPESAALVREYFASQQQLARLALAPADTDANRLAERRALLRNLSDKKERLERDLASTVPEFARQQSLGSRPHTDLKQQLPQNTAFVQLIKYHLVETSLKNGRLSEQRTPSYAAFIIAHDCPTEMIQLGPAEPIDAAVRDWRQAIADERANDAPAALRRLVWEPIEKKLPPDTTTVYLTPDGLLTAMPWSALPGKAAGSVLLEEYSLALVPYGPFLLDRLTAPPRTESADDMLLAVGGVSYDDQPAAPADAGQLAALRGEVGLEGPHVNWPELPGTRDEVDALSAVAGDRQKIVLSARDAGTGRVLAELPKARWAIFATHGFFADPNLRSALQLDESIFEHRDFLVGGERTTPVGRNPLLLSGLVLAGANLPRPEDDFGIPKGDGGILSAETIASLPLDKLELAVLSACDTGLGEVAGGEGVFGLQRAFHQAGAANVVASLWKIDDRATAALMRLFYYKLFRDNRPPLAALREAQLAIYHHPEQIGPLASARAPEFGKAVKLVDGGKPAASTGRAATRLWAGFVLSGAGR